MEAMSIGGEDGWGRKIFGCLEAGDLGAEEIVLA
jgi:hypothetical protein